MKINKIIEKLKQYHIINEIKVNIFSNENDFIIINVKMYSCKIYPKELKKLQLFLIKNKIKHSFTLEN